jgi:hypothetical protein
LLTADRGDLPPPDPALLTAVASLLRRDGHDLDASRFIRAAMPAALRAGQVQSWMRLTALGLQAARAAGQDATADLAYFERENIIRHRLQGDKITMAAAATAAAIAIHEHGHQAGAHGARQVLGPAFHRAARYGAKALSAGHGLAAAGATATIVVVTTVVVVVLPGGNTVPQLTGTQLAAALLPKPDLPGINSDASSFAEDSGDRVAQVPAGYQYAKSAKGWCNQNLKNRSTGRLHGYSNSLTKIPAMRKPSATFRR